MTTDEIARLWVELEAQYQGSDAGRDLWANSGMSCSMHQEAVADETTGWKPDLDKLSPKPGDLIVVRYAEKITAAKVANLQKELQATYPGVQFMVTWGAVEVGQLDEVEMEKHGWTRKQERGPRWL